MNNGRALNGLVDTLFVFIGLFIALKAAKYMAGMSTFLANAFIEAVIWLLVGWLLIAFSSNKYVDNLGVGFMAGGFYLVAEKYISF